MVAQAKHPAVPPALRGVVRRLRSLWGWTAAGILLALFLRSDLMETVDRFGAPREAYREGPWFLEACRLSMLVVALMVRAHLVHGKPAPPGALPAESAARGLSRLAAVLIAAVGFSPVLESLCLALWNARYLVYAAWVVTAAVFAVRALLRLQRDRQGLLDLARALLLLDRWRELALLLRGTVKCPACGGESPRGLGKCTFCDNPLPVVPPPPQPPAS